MNSSFDMIKKFMRQSSGWVTNRKGSGESDYKITLFMKKAREMQIIPGFLNFKY
jgi:hypothetical protein